GTVIILGTAGRNFAAGMSGGVAYVLDEAARFSRMCNLDMVSLEPLGTTAAPGQHLGKSDADIVRDMLARHVHYTGSPKAQTVLDNWDSYRMKFVKILPHEYRRAMLEMAGAAKVA
ncbi:MAG: hypothetical protein HAW59_01805, partial [Betaproteobacteria bacterium]|nr:hypothetical protein [Betaproteobacteria bacterium]